jgi:multicomponent Na+:H+ antiporter subunit E
VFVLCLALWLVLSGHPTPLHLAQGIVSAALVARLNRDLRAAPVSARAALRFAGYLPWLLKEIVLANIQVVRVVLAPRRLLDPVLVRVPCRLGSELAITTFANSITLTPGTITVDVEGRELVVHALTAQTPTSFAGMERRVAEVFGEADT